MIFLNCYIHITVFALFRFSELHLKWFRGKFSQAGSRCWCPNNSVSTLKAFDLFFKIVAVKILHWMFHQC